LHWRRCRITCITRPSPPSPSPDRILEYGVVVTYIQSQPYPFKWQMDKDHDTPRESIITRRVLSLSPRDIFSWQRFTVLREYTGPGYRPSGFDHVKQLPWWYLSHIDAKVCVEYTMRPKVVKRLYIIWLVWLLSFCRPARW